MSESLWSHGMQHPRLPCASSTPRACSNSWVGDAIQPSHPLLSLLLLPSVFPSIRVFSNESGLCMRWPKYWSFTSASVLPMNIQDWFPLGRTGWISLWSKGLLRIFFNTTFQKHQVLIIQFYIIKSLKWKFSNGKKFSHCILIIVRIIFFNNLFWMINYPTRSGLRQ